MSNIFILLIDNYSFMYYNQRISHHYTVYMYIGILVALRIFTSEVLLLTSILAWTSNHMHSKACGEIIYPYPNFKECAVEV